MGRRGCKCQAPVLLGQLCSCRHFLFSTLQKEAEKDPAPQRRLRGVGWEGFLEEVALLPQLPCCTAGSDAARAGPAISVSLQKQGQRGANPLRGPGWLQPEPLDLLPPTVSKKRTERRGIWPPGLRQALASVLPRGSTH